MYTGGLGGCTLCTPVGTGGILCICLGGYGGIPCICPGGYGGCTPTWVSLLLPHSGYTTPSHPTLLMHAATQWSDRAAVMRPWALLWE